MRNIYISGKITGNFKYIQEFCEAENYIKDRWDCKVFNPAKLSIILIGSKWEQFMKVDLMILELCDTIFMLQNWKESKGAQMEHEKAVEMGMKIIYEE